MKRHCEESRCASRTPRARTRKMADDDDDGSAALAAMRERLAALTQPAAGGMGQALEVAAMQDALATKLAASQARIDALMAGPSESDPPPAADDEVLEWQRKIAALSGTPTLAPPPRRPRRRRRRRRRLKRRAGARALLRRRCRRRVLAKQNCAARRAVGGGCTAAARGDRGASQRLADRGGRRRRRRWRRVLRLLAVWEAKDQGSGQGNIFTVVHQKLIVIGLGNLLTFTSNVTSSSCRLTAIDRNLSSQPSRSSRIDP